MSSSSSSTTFRPAFAAALVLVLAVSAIWSLVHQWQAPAPTGPVQRWFEAGVFSFQKDAWAYQVQLSTAYDNTSWHGEAHYVRSRRDADGQQWHTFVQRVDGDAHVMYYQGVQLLGDQLIRMVACSRVAADALFDGCRNDQRAERLLWPMLDAVPSTVKSVVSARPGSSRLPPSLTVALPWTQNLQAICRERPPVVEMATPLATASAAIAAAAAVQTRPMLQVIVSPCTPAMRGNSWCDDVCNNAADQWDGGDCCASTRRVLHSGSPNQCKAGRVALFLHGANWGNGTAVSGFSDTTHTKLGILDRVLAANMWGQLPRALRNWTHNAIYNWHDTTNFNWSDAHLQRTYYDKAYDVQQRLQGVVFAPAFASLVLAGACLDQGLCNVTWYAIGVPWQGTPVADFAYMPASDTAPQPMSVASRSMSPLYRDTRPLRQVARTLVLASLCGASAFGSGGDAGLQLASYAALSTSDRHWRTSSDGIVRFEECNLGVEATTTRVAANHHELVGMFADRASGESILNWYRMRLRDDHALR